MPGLHVSAAYQPTGDQPRAIGELAEAISRGDQYQTLLGATATGKTHTMARVIEKVQKPTLVIAHNKTLAAQLCNEFREYFPTNAVEYFVSYYDYYQPEAYLPSSDTYIEKDSSINDDIDRLRHAATAALFARRDVVIVASVSCIYGIGSPESYSEMVCFVSVGDERSRESILTKLVDIHYQRNDVVMGRGRFRVRGDVIEVQPADTESAYRISLFGDEVESITHFDPMTGEVYARLDHLAVYPATHYAMERSALEAAVKSIDAELRARLPELEAEGKMLEAHRLRSRTEYDMEMLREMGFCNGIENYSRHLDGREPGTPPHTLLDYFPDDFLIIIDESHQTVPQIGGMYEGDRSRKQTLVEYGFRLPSALDNRPLRFDEFLERAHQVMFVSATPAAFELRQSTPRRRADHPADRPRRSRGRGPPDAPPDRRPDRRDQGPRRGGRARAGHDAHQEDGRGPDRLPARGGDPHPLPALRDRHARADQDDPRAAPRRVRRAGGREPAPRGPRPAGGVAGGDPRRRQGGLPPRPDGAHPDHRPGRPQRQRPRDHVRRQDDRGDPRAIDETGRRRAIQIAYNEEHGITPESIKKGVSDIAEFLSLDTQPHVPGRRRRGKGGDEGMTPTEIEKLVVELEEEMFAAAEELRFEYAAKLRDEIKELRRDLDAARVQ